MKEFFFAMREIRPDEANDWTLGEILEDSDQLVGAIDKIRLRPTASRGREVWQTLRDPTAASSLPFPDNRRQMNPNSKSRIQKSEPFSGISDHH